MEHDFDCHGFDAGACSSTENETAADERTKVGIVLTEVGLGDRSFNDAAFEGLVQARNENTIRFDYKEPGKDLTTETAFEQFAQDGEDLIIGLSDTLLPDLEKVAEQYPEQQFLIVDGHSELPNVTSMSFRSEEGSYLAGMIAGFATTENHVGFWAEWRFLFSAIFNRVSSKGCRPLIRRLQSRSFMQETSAIRSLVRSSQRR